MKMIRDYGCIKLVLALTVLFILPSTPALASQDGERFRGIYEKEWAFRLKEFPLLASSVGVHDFDGQMGHVSEQDQARRNEFWKKIWEELDEISCQRLDPDECVNSRISIRQMDNNLTAYETRSYLIPFNSDSGFYTAWARLPQETDFTSVQDYRNYLDRLHQLPRVMDEYITLMREGPALGMTQPRVILDGRDEPVKLQLVNSAAKSPFFTPFMELPESLTRGEKAELLATAKKTVEIDVIPAYQRLYDFLQKEYFPGARSSLGASNLPRGEHFYQAQIRLYATVDMSPQQIHGIGLEQVARIRGEMEEIIREVGFEGAFAAFLEFLRSDPQFYAKTPRELLATASYYAKKIDGRLPMLFGHFPRQPYGVAPVPDDIAPFYTAARYVGAPMDSHRGGYYWVNTHDLKSQPLYVIPALTLHEAAPGHHLQGALAMEQQNQLIE